MCPSTQLPLNRVPSLKKSNSCVRTLPATWAARRAARRDSQRVVGPASVGSQRRRKDLKTFARPYHSGFSFRTHHRHGRQVDDLPPYGSGHDRSRRDRLHRFPNALTDPGIEAARLDSRKQTSASSTWESVYGSDLPALQALSQNRIPSFERPCCIRACPSGSAKSCGRRAMKWRDGRGCAGPAHARSLSRCARRHRSRARSRRILLARGAAPLRSLEGRKICASFLETAKGYLYED